METKENCGQDQFPLQFWPIPVHNLMSLDRSCRNLKTQLLAAQVGHLRRKMAPNKGKIHRGVKEHRVSKYFWHI